MPEPLQRFSEATVLVVDDNENNLALMQAILSRAGITNIVTESDSRRVVGRLLNEVEPDLIILDLHMPHVDGYQILGHIGEFSGGSYVPVLVVSADTTIEATRRALEAGAHDFITKPFDRTELILRARNLLENRFLRVTLRRHLVALGTELAPRNGGTTPPASDRRVGGDPDPAVAQLRRDGVLASLNPGNIQTDYQPVINTATSAVVGHEAITRFPQEPSRPAARWFADAFEVGMGVELELAAAKQALRVIDQLEESAFLAVKVSPRTVLSGELEELIPPSICGNVVLELFEDVPVENYDSVLGALATLRSCGVRLAVADVGAGYAGFRHLLSLRPDIIKLDTSLTRGVDARPSHRALTSAMVGFAADVGARLLAAGVETSAEVAALTDLGVTWMQGFAFARPHRAPVSERDIWRTAPSL